MIIFWWGSGDGGERVSMRGHGVDFSLEILQ